jgi:alkanesulfonate monooxygenase SsuD/methylene tetrahydromethanopterin reductase-like flavin-dependent oxidoreductase (luciferase family)
MDVGLNIQSLPGPRVSEQLAQIAVSDETCGLHSVCVSEHIVLLVGVETRDPCHEGGVLSFEIDTLYADAMVTLAYLAAQIMTLRLGTYVVPAIARDPLSLAKQASIVDVLSGGASRAGRRRRISRRGSRAAGPSRGEHRAGRFAETIEIRRDLHQRHRDRSRRRLLATGLGESSCKTVQHRNRFIFRRRAAGQLPFIFRSRT